MGGPSLVAGVPAAVGHSAVAEEVLDPACVEEEVLDHPVGGEEQSRLPEDHLVAYGEVAFPAEGEGRFAFVVVAVRCYRLEACRGNRLAAGAE